MYGHWFNNNTIIDDTYSCNVRAFTYNFSHWYSFMSTIGSYPYGPASGCGQFWLPCYTFGQGASESSAGMPLGKLLGMQEIRVSPGGHTEVATCMYTAAEEPGETHDYLAGYDKWWFIGSAGHLCIIPKKPPGGRLRLPPLFRYKLRTQHVSHLLIE